MSSFNTHLWVWCIYRVINARNKCYIFTIISFKNRLVTNGTDFLYFCRCPIVRCSVIKSCWSVKSKSCPINSLKSSDFMCGYCTSISTFYGTYSYKIPYSKSRGTGYCNSSRPRINTST